MIPNYLYPPDDRAPSMNKAWLEQLKRLRAYGIGVLPTQDGSDASLNRRRTTCEILHNSFAIDMNRPVLTLAARSMNYSFLAAEALWILAGDDRVETIAPYSSRLVQYSDDGKTFFGAYGPPIVRQLPYVVRSLIRDQDSRQAVISVWRESPGPTKNPPCTIALSFSLRKGKLHAHLYLRSSDTWLGLPYDLFGMACVAARVAAALYQDGMEEITLGNLYVVAASSHYYLDQNAAIDNVLRLHGTGIDAAEESPTLDWSHAIKDWSIAEEDLVHTRDKLVGRPVWLDVRPAWSYRKLELVPGFNQEET